jgi:hypothetical protein
MTNKQKKTGPPKDDKIFGSSFGAQPSTSGRSRDFYAQLTPFDTFSDILDPDVYRQLPHDWSIGVADVVHSTQAIAEGRYKTVNTVGAAVLAAVTNALPGAIYPFSFGGDGASLAVPEVDVPTVETALARTAAWAEDSLGLNLRVAMIPISAIREAGFDVRVARFAASAEVTYAMFAGGGLAWSDAKMKEGDFAISRAAPGETPDLAGLYCGFAPIKAQRGVILSLIAVPSRIEPHFAEVVGDIISLLDGSGQAGRPMPDQGPLPSWTASGLKGPLAGGRARTARVNGLMVLWRAVLARLILGADVPIGGYHKGYRRQLVQNTDFRKFDDCLRMTVDCSPSVADAIEARLNDARFADICRYGIHRQESANLTCYIPSPSRADHVHFVDGAAGGYAAAAAKLKAEARSEIVPN